EDLGLVRIDREHLVAMALEVVADEVARAELVAGQSHDRDRPRAEEHTLDRQRVLVSGEIGHLPRAKACSRSQIRSSTDSVPTDTLTVPGRTTRAGGF